MGGGQINNVGILNMLGRWSKSKRSAVESGFYSFLDCCYINSKDHGRICLGKSLYDGQRKAITEIFDALENDIHKIFILKSRQLGISTLIRSLNIFLLGIHNGLKGAIVFDTSDNKLESRAEIVSMIGDLPKSLKFPSIKGDNRAGLTLTNDSKVLFMSAGVSKRKSSGTLGRSVGLSLAHLSELCSYDNDEGLEAFENSLSDENPDRLYIYESTARGFNKWNDLWIEARADTDHCRCLFLGWWSKPSQRIDKTHADYERYGVQPPTDIEIKRMKEVKELYGHTITPEQLAWVRRKMDPGAKQEGDAPVEYEGSVTRLQEQPWCVTGETRVGTDSGIIPISQAMGAKHSTLGPIISAGPTGKAVIWKAKTKLGYELRGTANHPIINHLGSEIRLDLSLGQKIQLQSPMFSDGDLYEHCWQDGIIQSKILITERLAKFVGLFMGDGSASRGTGHHGKICEVKICCCKTDEDVVQETISLFRELFGVEPSVFRNEKASRGWVDVRSGTNLVFETIKKLGLLRNNTTRTMRKVHVPEFIWRSPKRVVKEFLSGLFEADGFNSFDTNRVSLFSKYPDFIRDVQLLLLAFGITSKATSVEKKAGDGHRYTGNQLDLRTAEAIKFNADIGFISSRKKSRAYKPKYSGTWNRRPKPSIVFEDTIVSVENEGVVEDVWNLTVEGSHLFDANGILTHNTETDAFQMTGSAFFAPETLTDQVNKHVSKKFKTYMFDTGIEFTDTRVQPAPNTRLIELKVWDEPAPDAVYVVSADVAFGSSEHNDRSAIQVLRCYADGLDQCAEYAWPLIGTRPFAWVILALAGWYAERGADIYLIIELNGPGGAVWDEISFLRHHIAVGYQPKEMEEKGLKNIFRNVKNYIYGRPDSMTAGRSWQWRTSGGAGPASKVRLMERQRDFVSNGMLHIRSLDTLEEMRSIARDGDSIAAQGRKKDDRVMALALGVRCWEERCRKFLTTQRRTREHEAARVRMTFQDQALLFSSGMLENFFAQKRAQRAQENRLLRRAAWRSR